MITVYLMGPDGRDIESCETDWSNLDADAEALVLMNMPKPRMSAAALAHRIDSAIRELRASYDHPDSVAELSDWYALRMHAS